MTEERIVTYQAEFDQLFNEARGHCDTIESDLRYCIGRIDDIRKMFLIALASGRIVINREANTANNAHNRTGDRAANS